MQNLKSYFYIITVLLTLSFFYYSNKVQIMSDTGQMSPYFKNRFWNKGVFFRTWSGDGLGGSYSYEKLNTVDTNFSVLEIEVLSHNNKEKIAIGKHKADFYFRTLKLPFDPTNNNWKEAFKLFGDNLIIVTKSEVYLLTNKTFVQIKDANANDFAKVGGFDTSNEMFTDKIRYFEIEYKEVKNSNGTVNLMGVIKTKPVS